MTANQIIIIGAGGFGREVHDVIVAINAAESEPRWVVVGFLDDGNPDAAALARIGTRKLGPVSDLARYEGFFYSIGIGSGSIRRELDDRATAAGLEAATLVHPRSNQGVDTQIGPGTVVCSHVSITTNVRIGRHVHLNLNCTVGHDAVLDDYVTVNPLSAISGDVHLSTGSTIGTTAAVLQGLTVGERSIVGAGAVVVKDVPNDVTVVGVPARAIGLIPDA